VRDLRRRRRHHHRRTIGPREKKTTTTNEKYGVLTFGPFDFTIHVFNLKSTYIQLFREITTTMLVRPQLSIVTSNYWEKRFVDGTNNSTLNQSVFN
jgi:hypothetical protein